MIRVTSNISKVLIRMCLILFLAASSFFVSAISTEERAYAYAVTEERAYAATDTALDAAPNAKESTEGRKGQESMKGRREQNRQARREKPQRIACVGASNVFGLFLKNRNTNSFPGKLQKKLGRTYTVKNFGSSGTTAILRSGSAYMRTKSFANSIAFKPDKVIILLGGNDLRKEYWKDYARKYKNTGTLYNKIADSILRDYKKLLGAYAKQVPKSKIYIMTPANLLPIRQHTRYLEVTLRVNARLKSLAKSAGYKLIDTNSAIKTNPRRYLQKDGMHFTLAGAERVASMAFRAVK